MYPPAATGSLRCWSLALLLQNRSSAAGLFVLLLLESSSCCRPWSPPAGIVVLLLDSGCFLQSCWGSWGSGSCRTHVLGRVARSSGSVADLALVHRPRRSWIRLVLGPHRPRSGSGPSVVDSGRVPSGRPRVPPVCPGSAYPIGPGRGWRKRRGMQGATPYPSGRRGRCRPALAPGGVRRSG